MVWKSKRCNACNALTTTSVTNTHDCHPILSHPHTVWGVFCFPFYSLKKKKTLSEFLKATWIARGSALRAVRDTEYNLALHHGPPVFVLAGPCWPLPAHVTWTFALARTHYSTWLSHGSSTRSSLFPRRGSHCLLSLVVMMSPFRTCLLNCQPPRPLWLNHFLSSQAAFPSHHSFNLLHSNRKYLTHSWICMLSVSSSNVKAM